MRQRLGAVLAEFQFLAAIGIGKGAAGALEPARLVHRQQRPRPLGQHALLHQHLGRRRRRAPASGGVMIGLVDGLAVGHRRGSPVGPGRPCPPMATGRRRDCNGQPVGPFRTISPVLLAVAMARCSAMPPPAHGDTKDVMPTERMPAARHFQHAGRVLSDCRPSGPMQRRDRSQARGRAAFPRRRRAASARSPAQVAPRPVTRSLRRAPAQQAFAPAARRPAGHRPSSRGYPSARRHGRGPAGR